MQEPNLASFGDDVNAIIARLLTEDKSFGVISITGMEGIESTTLSKLIFHHKAVINHFPFALWTSDGYVLLLRQNDKIMESLLKPEWRYREKRQRLEAFFVNNRSLIVVDDSPFPYEILRVLQDTFNGSRMILIGTKTWLPPDLKMKSDPHPLRLRTDEES